MEAAPRWFEVTSSPFPHEAEGLSVIRTLLPQTSPYRAWSNVEFRYGHGKWHEVDLIVLGQRRLHLVELKARPESSRQHYEARAGPLADPVRLASRSLSESPPQTPWGSGAANASARQSATTGQPRQMATAACSRRRCPGPRLPSGWKNSSGLAPRQAPCRCQRHFSVDDPGRPRRSAMGTSRRVVTTVIAPEVVRPPTRLVVVDRPGRSSPTRVACGRTQQHYGAAAPPVPDQTPVQENRDC